MRIDNEECKFGILAFNALALRVAQKRLLLTLQTEAAGEMLYNRCLPVLCGLGIMPRFKPIK